MQLFKGDNLIIYSDADHANNLNTRHSVNEITCKYNEASRR